jgi:peptide/nickel transport system substrate-binding protein
MRSAKASFGHVTRRRFLTSALGISSLGLFAISRTWSRPAGAATHDPALSGRTRTLALHWSPAAPPTFNPLFTTAGSEQQVERLVLGALLKMNDNLVPVPDLAERWDVSPDAKTYTFYLHKNIRWSDGRPLTAEDVLFTFERGVDKRTGSVWAARLGWIEGAAAYAQQKADRVTGLEALDSHTVRIRLAKPHAGFLTILGNYSGLGILPKHVLKDVPPDKLREHRFSMAPTVGAGAFTFVKYESDQYVELKRNDNYFRGKVTVERIFLKILQPDVGLAQLQTGEVDFAMVPVEEVNRLKRDPRLTIHSVRSPSYMRIAINCQKPYLKDKRVRQAMMYAIDRQGIADSIYRGQAVLVNSPIFGPDWMGQPEFNRYPFDPSKAKALLREAGWESNQKVALMISGRHGKEQEAYEPIIQQQLRDVGMLVEMRREDYAAARKYTDVGDFDLYSDGFGMYRAEPSIPGDFFTTRAIPPGGINYVRYSNSTVDQLFDQGLAVVDRTKRKEIYTEIARILNDELPNIFLLSPYWNYATSRRLQGFMPPSYADNYLWNAEEWSVTE